MLEKATNVDISNIAPLDIEDKEVPLSTFRGSVLVMAGGGRTAIEDSRKWAEALEVACKAEGAKFVQLAFVFHIPPFVPKGMIKERIKGSGAILPLFFWDEKPVKAMGVSDYDSSNILVVDKQGILRYLLIESFSESALDRILSQVKALNGGV